MLETIQSPADLKALPDAALERYASEVRACIIETVAKCGGHLASNLGTVELTIVLHRVFDCPKDKIVFDVGHQAYTHKLITGRLNGFRELRSAAGVSGFPRISESEYDAFSTGHSSTALSAGVGLARARDLRCTDEQVIAVVGDGALSGGMAFEALNHIGESQTRMLIVLNDNKMSIAKNVGAMSKYLAKLRTSRKYLRVKSDVKKGLGALPFIGPAAARLMTKLKLNLKSFVMLNTFFEELGIKYFGPFDGHDMGAMKEVFSRVQNEKGPVLIHVLTEKGHGDPVSVREPSKFHGVCAPSACKGESFAAILCESLTKFADEGKNIAAITAAMGAGTGLEPFSALHPNRYFDVGIAEAHAMTFAAGLAAGGVRPYFAVYSSFLQRAFDQVLHDVALDALPVKIMIEHAGAVEGDGVTHQGIYDIAFLSMIPNMTILQPKDGAEFERMLRYSLDCTSPLAIRYPKNFTGSMADVKPFDSSLAWEDLTASKNGVYILACGNRMLELALKAEGAGVINARTIKPLDRNRLKRLQRQASLVITLEDGVLHGGFGAAVRAALAPDLRVVTMGFPDTIPEGYTLGELFANAGLTTDAIRDCIDRSKFDQKQRLATEK